MKLTSLLLILCLPVFTFAQGTYKIYNTATQKPATLDDIITDMAKADVLFCGE